MYIHTCTYIYMYIYCNGCDAVAHRRTFLPSHAREGTVARCLRRFVFGTTTFFFTQLKMASLSNLAEFPQVVVVVLPA